MNTPPGRRPAGKPHKQTERHAEAQAIGIKVFIGYADVSAVRRATGTIIDTVRSSGRRVNVQPMLWRFSQLGSSHWADRAIAAALGADIIVLASSAGAAFTPAIEDWVNRFLSACRGRRATIVAISGRADAWTISIEQPAIQAGTADAGTPGLTSASSRLVA